MDQGFTLWLTGLSGVGKTTLARAVSDELAARGLRVEILDGDEVRNNLSKGLGFSKEDRDTNVRRIGFVTRLLSRNGIIAIAAAISPYRAIRDEVRRAHEAAFVEVFLDCPLEELIRRDTKGLYAKAKLGEILNVSGLSAPYEPPLTPDIHLKTDIQTIEESRDMVLHWLERRSFIGSVQSKTGR
jgi:adenylylsulfate kinase